MVQMTRRKGAEGVMADTGAGGHPRPTWPSSNPLETDRTYVADHLSRTPPLDWRGVAERTRRRRRPAEPSGAPPRGCRDHLRCGRDVPAGRGSRVGLRGHHRATRYAGPLRTRPGDAADPAWRPGHRHRPAP